MSLRRWNKKKIKQKGVGFLHRIPTDAYMRWEAANSWLKKIYIGKVIHITLCIAAEAFLKLLHSVLAFF